MKKPHKLIRIIIPLSFIFPVILNAQYQDSLELALSNHIISEDTPSIIKTAKKLAVSLRKEHRFDEVKQLIRETLPYSKGVDRLWLVNTLGQSYIDISDYDRATEQYDMLLRESDKLDNDRYRGFALNNIGYIHYQNDNLDKSLDYHQRALEIRLRTGDKKRIGSSYNNIGLVHFHRDSLAKALEHFKLALEMFRESGYNMGESNVLNNIGNIYIAEKNYEKALEYHEKGLMIRTGDLDLRGMAESYKNLAKIYTATSDFPKAEKCLENGLKSAQEIAYKHLIKDFHFQRFELYKARGMDNEALHEYILYTNMKDSIVSVESKNRIAELDIKYQTERKERRIEYLDQENTIQEGKLTTRKYMLIAALIFILLISAVFILLIRQNRLRSRLNIELNRQKLLRSQMNPHFMYNALGAIQNFILQNNPIDSVGYISEFSGLMRLVLEGSRHDFVSVSDDIKLVNSYLKLQKLRFDGSFGFEVEIDDDLNPDLYRIPPMLTQPFIENAVEHGMRELEPGKGKIKVRYGMKNDLMIISVADNGKGIMKNEVRKNNHNSLATDITLERIENIRKAHNLTIIMEVISDSITGTIITFTIPHKSR